ncbi:MAG: hypothetical protein QW165_04535 [Candidatus Woesearchaeota archaeon]
MDYETGKALERHEEMLQSIIQVLKDKKLIEAEQPTEEKLAGKKK